MIVCLSMYKLMTEFWSTFHTNHEPAFGITEKHAAAVEFLVSLTEYASIVIYNGDFVCDGIPRACIIDWSVFTTNWSTMKELDDLIKYARHIPEDVDIFVSDDVIDWTTTINPRIDSMIRKWKEAIK